MIDVINEPYKCDDRNCYVDISRYITGVIYTMYIPVITCIRTPSPHSLTVVKGWRLPPPCPITLSTTNLVNTLVARDLLRVPITLLTLEELELNKYLMPS